MNKLIVDKENNIEIKDNVINLKIDVTDLIINIKGKVLITEIDNKDNEDLKLTINLEPNSTLIYNRFMLHTNMNNKIVINQQYNSTLSFNYSFIAYDKCNLIFNTNLNGSNNNTNINVKAVTQKLGSVVVSATATVSSNIKDNDLIEDIRVLLLNNEESIIIPNLLVSSNEVTVNHAATMSNIDPNYLFYLNGKGLNNDSAQKLIKTGYLLNNLQIVDEDKDKIKNMI